MRDNRPEDTKEPRAALLAAVRAVLGPHTPNTMEGKSL